MLEYLSLVISFLPNLHIYCKLENIRKMCLSLFSFYIKSDISYHLKLNIYNKTVSIDVMLVKPLYIATDIKLLEMKTRKGN